ncbi:VaFE repeat-containing surface-anchored protein [Boudabousia liubingyangii]|uniref:VaFE repeat-containing surface-anchored protein n=1 Tax=Boudabousia liubingyangii TaxID=1921764 RepID=UPI0009F87951|nr:VaFE repeat-containing surface-anchored protein [Boudabousia liubingyangii]
MKSNSRIFAALSALAVGVAGIAGIGAASANAAETEYQVKIGEATSESNSGSGGLDENLSIVATNPRILETEILAGQVYSAWDEQTASKVGLTHLKGYRTSDGREGYGFCIEPTIPTYQGVSFESSSLANYQKKDPNVGRYLAIVQAVKNADSSGIDAQRVNQRFGVHLTPEAIVWAAQYAIWSISDPDFKMRSVEYKPGNNLILQTVYNTNGTAIQGTPSSGVGPTLPGGPFEGKYRWFDIDYSKANPKLTYEELQDVYKLYEDLFKLPAVSVGGSFSNAGDSLSLDITDAKGIVNDAGEGVVTYKFSKANAGNPAYSVDVLKGARSVDGIMDQYVEKGDEASVRVIIPSSEIDSDGLEPFTVKQKLSGETTGSGSVIMHPVEGGSQTQSIITLGQNVLATDTGTSVAAQSLTFSKEDAPLVPEKPTPDKPTVPSAEKPFTPEVPVVPETLAPVIKTTVAANGTSASAEAAAQVSAEVAIAGVDVVDTVSYQNLKPETYYKVSGELFKVQEGKTVGEAVATQNVIQKATAENGTFKLDFGKVQGLEPGASYVVFETVTPVTDEAGKTVDPSRKGGVHKDPKDNSQTVVITEKPEVPEAPVEPEAPTPIIKTTVSAYDAAATEDAPLRSEEGTAQVTDIIAYQNLVKGTKYRVEGSFYEVKNGATVGDALKSVTEVKTAEENNGTFAIYFGALELQAGKIYVVFEKVIPVTDQEGKKEDPTRKGGKHEDPTAPSQTIVVNERPKVPTVPDAPVPVIKTTVVANGASASPENGVKVEASEVANGLKVVDTVSYQNLKPETYYKVSGELLKVQDGKAAGKAVAKAQSVYKATAVQGEFKLDFGKVQGLEPGASYVVFETVTAVTDAGGKTVDPSRKDGEHKDPKDPSQTVVVVENPAKPATPEKPAKPAKPATPEGPENVSPKQPTKPSRPINPEKPVAPVTSKTPENPAKPATPEKPAKPAKPVTPEGPEDVLPKQPTKPSQPINPEKPVTPETPKTPESPAKPASPEKPAKPVTPEAPGNEATAETPKGPEKPKKPNTPAHPAKPSAPQNPGDTAPNQNTSVQEPKDGLASTGSDSLILLGGALILLAGGVGLVTASRRRS